MQRLTSDYWVVVVSASTRRPSGDKGQSRNVEPSVQSGMAMLQVRKERRQCGAGPNHFYLRGVCLSVAWCVLQQLLPNVKLSYGATRFNGQEGNGLGLGGLSGLGAHSGRGSQQAAGTSSGLGGGGGSWEPRK